MHLTCTREKVIEYRGKLSHVLSCNRVFEPHYCVGKFIPTVALGTVRETKVVIENGQLYRSF